MNGELLLTYVIMELLGKPHPNAKIIAGMIRNNLMELGYDFRD